MIEASWDRRPCGIQTHSRSLTTPPWPLAKSITNQLSERPISVYTALSKLRFVSDEDEDTSSDPESSPPSLSPVSRLQSASPEETVAPMTPRGSAGSPPHAPSFSSPVVKSPSPSTYGPQTWMTPGKRVPSTTYLISASPQQLGWTNPKLDGAAVSSPTRVWRPLPEVPEHTRTRPLPPRPSKMGSIPCSQGSGRFSYPPHQQLVQGSSKDILAVRPLSDSGPVTQSQLVEGKRPKRDPTPDDTTPVPPITSPPAASSPSPPPSPSPLATFCPPLSITVPIVFPMTPKPCYPAPILPDLLSPTCVDLVTATGLTITGENGEEILFGALFRDRKVVAIFIRHFWCMFCQDYVRSISNSVTREILEKKGVDLVLIGNGAPGMIKAYKKTLNVPFAMYTDSSLQLHDALGLYKTSNVRAEGPRGRATGGSYVKHNGRWASLRVAVRTAAAKAVRIGNGPESGDLERLGGEFVFGPGLKSSFIHKMQNTRDHAPIVEVLEAAGVEVREKVMVRVSNVGCSTPTTYSPMVVDIGLTTMGSPPQPSPTHSWTIASSAVRVSTSTGGRVTKLGLTAPCIPEPEPSTPIIEDAAEWMAHRSNSLTRIKQKREVRRRGGVVQSSK